MKKIVASLILGFVVSAGAQATEATPLQAVLKKAFECKQLNYKQFDAALKVNKIPFEGADFTLTSPVDVFGLPITKIAINRVGGEDSYTAIVTGKPIKDVAKAAHIEINAQGSYSKNMGKRTLLVMPNGSSEVFIQCLVNLE